MNRAFPTAHSWGQGTVHYSDRGWKAQFGSYVQLILIGVRSLPSDSTASALPSVPTISYRSTRHLSRPGQGSPNRSVSGSFRDMYKYFPSARSTLPCMNSVTSICGKLRFGVEDSCLRPMFDEQIGLSHSIDYGESCTQDQDKRHQQQPVQGTATKRSAQVSGTLCFTFPRPREGSPGEPYTAENTTTRGRFVGTCRDTSSARWPSCRESHVQSSKNETVSC